MLAIGTASDSKKFYLFNFMKCIKAKFQSYGWRGAKVIFLSIFKNSLIILGLVLTTSLWLNAYVCDLKSLAAGMLLGLGIYAAGKNKVTGSNAPAVKLLQ